MRIVQTWMDNDLSDKEIRSSDNKEVGHAKVANGNGSMLVSVKGMRMFNIPRDAIATFDGEKIYLRATEAEVTAGVYPFLGETDVKETEITPTKAI
jgi:hypothetical protein